MKDISCLEQICRATKLNYAYKDRLVFGLTTLKIRRLRGDLIETYKILTKKEHIDPNQL